MAAETRPGQLWAGGHGLDDEPGGWMWVRLHRIYCAAMVAIVVVTLLGAHWAGQPSGEMTTRSSSSPPSATAEAPAGSTP